jgi:outer membrane protein OmpA-like peptidoglycan-associated protein
MRNPASLRTLFASGTLFLVLASCTTVAQQTAPQIPPQLSFLPSLGEVRKNIEYEKWGEQKFAPGDTVKRGQHWTLLVNLKASADKQVIWAAFKPTFLKNGWTVVKEFGTGSTVVTVSYKQNGVEAWAAVDINFNVVKVDMVVVGPVPITLTLAAPAATPEKTATAKGDFPYLAPLPGSKFHSGSQDASPFWVFPKGASQKEMVAPTSLVRSYSLPELSNLMFMTVYRDALTKAGWEIVEQFMGADASLTAHYSRNGRNIWAMLHNNSDGYTIAVADTGNDLSASLAKTCHVALYGVLFDFNKSTLQSTSDAVLQQVANLLAADKMLTLEVQGHTDNVGNDAYNQKLSEDRAHSVVVWLTAHSVAANRLTSKGYGKMMPVADNSTDPGRAKNRRVEIADPRCTAKTPMKAGN